MSSQLLRKLGALTVGVLVIALGAAAPAQAEATTGTISGHVTRPDGSPAAGEWIFAEDVSFEHPGGSAVTDESGFYSIPDLDPGSYQIRIPRGSLQQYAHGKVQGQPADLFTVAAGAVTTVDERLLALGTLQLTVTEYDGTPARGEASVHLNGQWFAGATLSESGEASIEVFAGEYMVSVTPAFVGDPTNLNYARNQWLYGKASEEQADVVVVAPETTTAVTEQLLTPGSVTVTARDSIDGSAIADFCVSAPGRWECSDGSESVRLANISTGAQTLGVYPQSDRYFSTDTTVTVLAGENVDVVVTLERAGRITTTVVDATTGQPVADTCIATAKAGGPLPDGAGYCSDAEGRVTVGALRKGAYNVFVKPYPGSGYGAQWVGSNGGTGNQAQARVVSVDPVADAVVPPIKLDRAGTIAGVVTSAATRRPVTSGYVSLSAWGRVGPGFSSEIDGSGHYTLDWLGPYEWPLVFTTDDHARQWSGGVADRRDAKKIRVQAGKTTTYNEALKVGTVWTGRFTDAAGNPVEISFDAYNAATGDQMGGGDTLDGAYRTLILGPQTIKVKWSPSGSPVPYERWYDDAVDFEHAAPVDVPRKGTLTLNMVVALP
jgi:hypothetical protein